MCEVRDERLQAIVNGEFLSEQGRVNGAYTTVDDAFVLVNVNVLERLLYKAPAPIELSYEEIKAKYAERIIADYFTEQEKLRKQHISNVRREVAKRNSQARRNNAKGERLLIIREIILGKSLADVINEYHFSKSKVYDVFRKYCVSKIYDLYADYRQNPKFFEEVSTEQIKEFLELKGSFKELNRVRDTKAQAQAIEKAESDAKIDAFWTNVKEKYEAYRGEGTQEAEKEQVNGTDAATVESIQALLGVASEAPVVKERVVEEKVFEEVNSRKVIEESLETRLKESALAKRVAKARLKTNIFTTPVQVEQDSVCELEENEIVTENVVDTSLDEWGGFVG